MPPQKATDPSITDDLLMVRGGPHRMQLESVVEAQAPVRLPAAIGSGRVFTPVPKHQRIISGQNKNPQPSVTPQEKVQEVAQQLGDACASFRCRLF